MNFNSIRTRYSFIFCGIAVLMAIASTLTFNLINSFESGLHRFSQEYTPAISAVINADRDLYQARTAELNALLSAGDSESYKSNLEGYEENAQQAYDRMHVLLDLLAADTDIAASVAGFENAYKAWKSNSAQVFNLLAEGKVDDAKVLSAGASNSTFGSLRNFYDTAGEGADEHSQALSNSVLDEIDTASGLLFLLTALTVMIALGVGLYAPRAMSLSLSELVNSLHGLNSGDGDLTRRIRTKRKDEIGNVANEVDELLAGLSDLIRGIVDQSGSVIHEVNIMAKGAQMVQQTSNEQLESVEMAATAVQQMTVAIQEVAQNAQGAATEITEVNRLTNEGKTLTEASVNQIKQMSETVSYASDTVSDLAESSKNIATVLEVIRGIAEQTNLLALNAAIEAARAGEQGRGFAVVADEVRSLASKTGQSTDDIQTMIEALQKGVSDAVDAIAKGNSATEQAVSDSSKMIESLQNIDEAAKLVTDASLQIAASTEEQSHVAEEVNLTLVKLSDLAQDNAERAGKNGEISRNASEVAQSLNDSVIKFRLD